MSITSALRNAVRHTRRTAVAGLAGAAGLAILAAPLAHADAAGTCPIQLTCISNVSVQAGGLNASIVFDTQRASIGSFQLSYNGSVVTQANSTPQAVVHHQITTRNDLDPNRTYNWLLVTTLANGKSESRAGTVTTLHRQVDVQFTTITVTDDSDTTSAGDFRTWVRAGNLSHIDNQVPESINTGQTVLASDFIRVRDAGDTVPVYTEMYDNDTFNPFLPSSQWPSPTVASWGSGSSTIADWGTAKTTLVTWNAQSVLQPFQMEVRTGSGSPSGVGFVVHGFFSVSFVS